MKKASWVNGLDSLRFFLALIVVLSHMPNPIAITLKSSSYVILQDIGLLLTPIFCGVGAVIAFFIISGFVIHYPNKDKEINYSKFLLRRWIRLGIPMIVISIIAIKLNMFLKLPLWSLYCELIYYTIYPLLAKLKISWTTQFWAAFVIAAVLIVTLGKQDILSLIHQKNLHFSGSYWQLGVQFTWIVGLPCWLLGVVLGEKIDSYTFKISTMQIYRWRLGVFAVSALIQIVRFKLFVSWLVSMNIFAFLLFIWLRNEIIYYRDHKSVRIFENFGKFSYSLYLTHELLFFIVINILPLNILTYPVYIAMIVLMAYIVFNIIEKPSHLLAQKVGATKKPLAKE